MEKMTYVTVLDKVIAGEVLTSEEIGKVKALREQTAKRHAKSDKPTKAQREKASADEALRAEVIDAMVGGTDYKTADIVALVDGIKSTQYAVGIMKPLVESGAVVKSTVKGATVYRKADAE